jgi:hypothetical protein
MKQMQCGKVIGPAAALIAALVLTGCTSGPLGSHGVDYIPTFDTAPPNAAIDGKLLAQAATIEGNAQGSN